MVTIYYNDGSTVTVKYNQLGEILSNLSHRRKIDRIFTDNPTHQRNIDIILNRKET